MPINPIPFVIAEDEPPIRKNLIKKICRYNPDFLLTGEASSGKKALELVREKHPQVLFTDIRMPGMDGLELMQELRTHYPEVLLVVISGYNDFGYAQTSIRLGVTDYLLKPVDTEQLKKTMDKLKRALIEKNRSVDNQIDWYEDRAGKDLAAAAAELIRTRFRENLSIAEMAEELRVNPTYLSRTFKECYGMTPTRFIQEQRMDLAKRLLIQYPRMEVKEVSAFTGYTDQNYFSRVFKKETGWSPQEFRQNR